ADDRPAPRSPHLLSSQPVPPRHIARPRRKNPVKHPDETAQTGPTAQTDPAERPVPASPPPPRLRRMRWWDIERVAELDTALFGPDTWTPEFFWSQLASPVARMTIAVEPG